MLGKYFKFLSPEKPSLAQNDSDIALGPAPIERMVPVMEAPVFERSDAGKTIDTADELSVISNRLDIPTHGVRTQATELLNRFLGRLPILDLSGETVGYEMRIKKAAPPPGDGAQLLQQMVDEMLLSSMEDLDIQKLRGDKQIFISLSAPSLNTEFLDRMEGSGIVLMFAPPEAGSLDTLIARCQALHEMGYRFGLQQLKYREELDDLLPLVDYLRIDPTLLSAMQLGELVVQLRSHGDFELIANPVESEELYAVCQKLKLNLFQGYYFAKPLPVRATKVDSQRLRVMQLLNLTLNHAEIAELEKHFKPDPVLSYKLLRFINSPATGLMQPVRSVNHALVVLGYDPLYRWLTLLLFASGQPDHRTLALMKNALVRARLTELLGQKKLKPQDQDGLFITGIFSLLDALLNLPMETALASLKLPAVIEAALTKREGIYAPYLDLAIACEEAEDQVIATYAAVSGISAEAINLAHVQALVWAEEVDLGKA